MLSKSARWLLRHVSRTFYDFEFDKTASASSVAELLDAGLIVRSERSPYHTGSTPVYKVTTLGLVMGGGGWEVENA